MLKEQIKAIIKFNHSQTKAPNFFLVYALVWLLWHHQFFIDFIAAKGSFANRWQVVSSQNENQFFAVLIITILLFCVRLCYLYLTQKTNDLIEEDEPVESKIGRDQLFTENKDVKRLLTLFEETKAKLASAKESNQQLLSDNQQLSSTIYQLKAELEEVQADLAVITKDNETLRSKLKSIS